MVIFIKKIVLNEEFCRVLISTVNICICIKVEAENNYLTVFLKIVYPLFLSYE